MCASRPLCRQTGLQEMLGPYILCLENCLSYSKKDFCGQLELVRKKLPSNNKERFLFLGNHRDFLYKRVGTLNSVLRIRIRMFLGLLDPDTDLLVRVMDTDPES
jgi:hypothetical protein